MEFVEPIRDKEDIERMKRYLREWSERNYILFLFGINTGLRISDLLKLRAKDVAGWYVVIREKKTGKHRRFKMPKKLKKEVREYTRFMDPDDYLFLSRQGNNKPIDRRTADWILKVAAGECGLEHIGTHSMRKTYGYHYYKQFGDVADLMTILNHSSPKITLRYIGVYQDHLDKRASKFNL